MNHLFTDLSGWFLLALLATTVTLPFVLRRRSTVLNIGGTIPFLQRMRPHFWIGYSLLPLTLAHAWPSMSEGWVRQVDSTGLYLASVVFLLLPVQVILGTFLHNIKLRRRVQLRRIHFWTMASIVTFVVGHVLFNGGVVRMLVR